MWKLPVWERSPTIIEARVPQYQEDDILDFKFEFFDYNGVRADLIMVTESVSFEGGNTYINGEGYLGEGVIFDGNILHAGSHPKNSDCRIVINIDFNYA